MPLTYNYIRFYLGRVSVHTFYLRLMSCLLVIFLSYIKMSGILVVYIQIKNTVDITHVTSSAIAVKLKKKWLAFNQILDCLSLH